MLSEVLQTFRKKIPGAWRDGSERGFTLIEMIVAITLLGIIMLPLSMAVIGILKNTVWANEALDRNNDAQRLAAAWTSDVQNVEPGGVNPAGSECRPAQTGTQPETALVTFRWRVPSEGAGGGQQEIAASWTAVGTGPSLALWRRECANGTLTNAQKLAPRIGSPGKQGIDVVHGPAKRPENGEPHTARSFCPSVDTGPNGYVGKTCTMVIDGSWKYELEVTRRVPDTLATTEFRQAPAAPRNLTGSPRNQSIVARFETPIMQPGQPPVDQYRVRAVPVGGGAPVEAIVNAGSNPVLGTVTGLSNTVEYTISVQAHNEVGWGDWTADVGPLRPVATEPNAPIITEVVPGDKAVTVRWTAPDNDGGSPILRWHLYGQDDSGNWLNNTGGIVSPLAVNQPGGAAPASTEAGGIYSAAFPDLINGTSYHFFVAGVNAINSGSSAPNPPLVVQPGEGLFSVESAGVTPYGPPSFPTGVDARASNAGDPGGEATALVTVRWSPPSDTNGGEIIGYRVLTYKGENAATPVSTDGDLLTPTEAGCGGSQPTDVCSFVQTVEISTTVPADYYQYTVTTRSEAPSGDKVESVQSPKSTPDGAQRTPPARPPHVRASRAPDAVAAAPIITAGAPGKLQVSFVPPFDGGEPIESARLLYRTRSTGSSVWSSDTEARRSPSGTSPLSVTIDAPSPGRYIDVRVAAGSRGEWITGDNYRYGGLSPRSVEYLIPGAPGQPTTSTLKRPATSFGTELVVGIIAPTDTGGTAITGYDVTCTVSEYPTLTVTRRFTAAGEQTISGAGGAVPNTGRLRDGALYTCKASAINAQGPGPASSASPANSSYGECTVRSDLTHHIKMDSGAQSTRNQFWVRQGSGGWFSPDPEAGLIRFNWNANCVSRADGLPANVWVQEARFEAHVDTSRNRANQLQRITSAWSASTTWSGPGGTKIADWCANSTGWKGSGTISALAPSAAEASRKMNLANIVTEQRAGTINHGFAIRDDGGGCGVSINSDSVVYSGSAATDAPRVVISKFYTQGAWPE